LEEEIKCCTTHCDKPLNADYWNEQYISKNIGWDLGYVSPPIKNYIDTIEDKSISILIPGCGNAYEAEYLLDKGFCNITIIDIAAHLVKSLQDRFANHSNINIILGDFFEHLSSYDLIIEQTFFCALPPTLRQKYVWKMHQLLKPNGKLIGLLFNRDFDSNPPFGGSAKEYQKLFAEAFYLSPLINFNYSATPRKNTEIFIDFKKNNNAIVTLYKFKGITCSGCKDTITEKFEALNNVLNVSINTNFSEVLMVSTCEINMEILQKEIAYDTKYSIENIN
jgi:methyl halide transferase